MVSLRPVKYDDFLYVFTLMNDEDVKRTSINKNGVSFTWLSDTWITILNSNAFFIIEADDKPVGILSTLNDIITISINSSHRGMGYGSDAIRQVICSDKQFLISIDESNIKSKNFFSKLGFTYSFDTVENGISFNWYRSPIKEG